MLEANDKRNQSVDVEYWVISTVLDVKFSHPRLHRHPSFCASTFKRFMRFLKSFKFVIVWNVYEEEETRMQAR